MLGRSPEESKRLRRWGTLAILLLGLLVATRWFKGSFPREHDVVIRLPPDSAASQLSVNFTPVGEAEPTHGLQVALAAPAPRVLREKVKLPDGDYIVILELTYGANAGPSAPKKSETSRARRVTLAEAETLVVFEAEGSE